MKVAAFYVILTTALLAESGAAAAQDSAAGKAAFGKCQACHAVGMGAKNKLGPELNGLAVRKAGAVAGYQYSPALKNSGFAWDQASFAGFMQNPRLKVPGNKMAFAGIKDQAEIASLWAYLTQFNADGSPK
jgi:cytochrome c